MFKSSFSKYLAAFVLIIFLSFLMLSGIITSMIRSYVDEDTREGLELATELVTKHFEDSGVENIAAYGSADEAIKVIKPIVNFFKATDIAVCDAAGKVIIKTFGEGTLAEDGTRVPIDDVRDGFGHIDVSVFKPMNDNEELLEYKGSLDGFLPDESLVYARPIMINGEVGGYVLSFASAVSENHLVGVTRRAVLNSSIWVMLAAVIAIYFITERIIHPLRTMTGAAKKFAKGDFSQRVTVYGKDEVAELGKAFNNMADSLDSLEKMRNSFIANVSHDLRTPMTTILGFIEGIKSGAIPPEKHDYYLGIISSEVHRLSRLVSQTLDISRLESGERKFSFADFDVAETARLILISFEKNIDNKKLDVYFEAEEDEMIAFADKDAIHQVLYNLCHNAIKFSKDGGKFVISISRAAGKKIRISVFDEGESIPTEDLKMVFDRFYKTDKSRGLDKNGVGLGLYISKAIIDAHEEEIWAESKDGGTEFIFTLKEGAAKEKRKNNG